MDESRLLFLPLADHDRDLADVAVAIRLVATGGARRVTLSGLGRSEAIAGEALALAQAAGVGFALERGSRSGPATIIVGPVEA